MALMPLLDFLGSHPNSVDVFDWEAAISWGATPTALMFFARKLCDSGVSWGATPTALMFLVGKLRIYVR